MDMDVKASQEQENEQAEACPLDAPSYGRLPGLMALAAVVAGAFTQPLFFALAGGLLAVLSLLLSPPRCRVLGLAALVAACAVGLRAFF